MSLSGSNRPVGEILDDEDLWARRFALKEANKTGDVATLIAGLTDPDHRGVAARYLGRAKALEARVPLERLLAASDPDVRAAAVGALGQIGAPESTPLLVKTAQSDEAINVRTWAIMALGEGKNREAMPHLLSLLQNESTRIRLCAVLALREMNSAVAIPALRNEVGKEALRMKLAYWRAIASLTIRGTRAA